MHKLFRIQLVMREFSYSRSSWPSPSDRINICPIMTRLNPPYPVQNIPFGRPNFGVNDIQSIDSGQHRKQTTKHSVDRFGSITNKIQSTDSGQPHSVNRFWSIKHSIDRFLSATFSQPTLVNKKKKKIQVREQQ